METALEREMYLEYAQALKGWGGVYYHVMVELINREKLKHGAEIGVAFGGHIETIFKWTEAKSIIAVDPYICYGTGSWGWTQEKMDVLKKVAQKNLKNHNVLWIHKPSIEASSEVQESVLDWVFIDGEHSYEAAKADLEAWEKKVKTGGYICGDDYNFQMYPGVVRAVEEFCQSKGVVADIKDGHVFQIKKKW